MGGQAVPTILLTGIGWITWDECSKAGLCRMDDLLWVSGLPTILALSKLKRDAPTDLGCPAAGY
ncbi:hypothetical protein [Ruegeria sp. HKCCA6707]|uniref:hypothetical protein n=1 Tax=Ruegeria sp. HKCCA6707 TaxID=2682996 RepID=UPI001C2B958B|nr:hypothetical protein [Ruegeria sp. HKCCA6707]